MDHQSLILSLESFLDFAYDSKTIPIGALAITELLISGFNLTLALSTITLIFNFAASPIPANSKK